MIDRSALGWVVRTIRISGSSTGLPCGERPSLASRARIPPEPERDRDPPRERGRLSRSSETAAAPLIVAGAASYLQLGVDRFPKIDLPTVIVTTTYPGVVKAWHLHKVQEDNFCCVKGMVKLVLYDGRQGSPTKGTLTEYFIGEHNMRLIRVPAGVHHGWKCFSGDEAIVINVPTEPFDPESPDEYRTAWDSPDIPYSWDVVFK
jgi:dTDP-4-dehydrorhamnose 3,5-epimerase